MYIMNMPSAFHSLSSFSETRVSNVLINRRQEMLLPHYLEHSANIVTRILPTKQNYIGLPSI